MRLSPHGRCGSHITPLSKLITIPRVLHNNSMILYNQSNHFTGACDMWRTGTELPDRWSNGSLCCNFGTCHLLVNVFEPHCRPKEFRCSRGVRGVAPSRGGMCVPTQNSDEPECCVVVYANIPPYLVSFPRMPPEQPNSFGL